MPRKVLPRLESLLMQMNGIIGHYRQMLDDDFLFGSAAQVPQVATLFDRTWEHPLHFRGEDLHLAELLTLIAYRYGLESVRVVGHGGYAVVLGHRDPQPPGQQPRVLRLVPEHHVRSILWSDQQRRPFDVRLDADNEPIRDPAYPLLLSDLFLLPRHTTKLVFCEADGRVAQAGGYPAILHCQVLPEVLPFNSADLNSVMVRESGDLLEAALATLGVSVADAHGGNGGALMRPDGQPIVRQPGAPEQRPHYIPIVLDYGYYAQIGAQTLASLLVRYGVTEALVREQLPAATPHLGRGQPWEQRLAHAIAESGLKRSAFGRLLTLAQPHFLELSVWIDHAASQWQTAKEKTYPALRAQSRLSRLYPDYDEVLFPQRIEEYTFTL